MVLCATLNATPESDEVRALTGKAAAAVKDFVLVDAWEAAGEGDGCTWSMGNPVRAHLHTQRWCSAHQCCCVGCARIAACVFV